MNKIHAYEKMKVISANSIFVFTLTCVMSLSVHLSAQNDIRTPSFPKKELEAKKIPKKKNTWVFILAGQSNMAGRGLVEPQDTIPSERIFAINKNGKVIIAKEPLHFYESTLAGLDCGLSFGNAIVKEAPSQISVLVIPTAVGGSSISQWLGDSIHRNVKLLTNFKEKVAISKKYGKIKGILWHQGESDTNPKDAPLYSERLTKLFKIFREAVGNENLPILIGELGGYSDNKYWAVVNEKIHQYSATDKNTAVINTVDLKDKGDKLHFNSKGQRILGQRFAEAYLKIMK
ncbi:MAG TPA: sialate O-acetylesterase [Cyclobacteriaceae bacterium]|jgi:hypothetical protein|nr:sialate O-acetylesterase [Cyclobacteriaceae bacterium]